MHEKYAIQDPISHVPICHPALFWDNCDCTFNYESSGTGADWLVHYGTYAAHSCLKGIHLRTRLTTPAIGDLATIWKYLPLPAIGRLTLEFLFMYRHSGACRFMVDLAVYLANNTFYSAALRFTQTGNLVQYRNVGYGWTTIPTLSHGVGQYFWSHVLLAISWPPPLFNLITVNETLYALPLLPLYTGAHVGCRRTRLLFTIETRYAAYRDMAIDHVLLTPNNP